MKSRAFLRFVTTLALVSGCVAVATSYPFLLQQADPTFGSPFPVPPRGGRGGRVEDPEGDEALRQMATKRNAERQKSLVGDAQQLLKLANEVNDTVAKSGDAKPSPDTIRKTEEVERLARQVKDKMIGN